METMLNGTLATVMTSWKNQHTQWVLRQMTQNFLNNLMTTWKTLTHPHLICMNQQIAIFKKHVSFCLLSRVPEAIFCCWHWCLARPASDRKHATARGKGKKKGKDFFAQRWKVSKPWNTLSLAKTTHLTCRVSSTDCQKKRPTETSTIRGGPHHAPRLRPDQCMLCRQVGHRASECLHKEKATSRSPGKRAFGTHALGCAVFGAMCYGATVDDTEEEQDANDIENFAAFSIESLEGFATPVGRAMKAVSGFTSVESLLSCHLQLSNHRMCITAMGLGCLHWLAHTARRGHVQSVSSYWRTVSFAWAVHTEERKWR